MKLQVLEVLKPKLSICIPTYNRANLLEATILRLIDQVSCPACEGKIEILIGDNASTDFTERIGQKFAGLHSYIKYHKNNTNIGAERNWLNLSKLAKGDFFWVLADDDYIQPGVLQKIIANSNEQQVGLIYINYSIWSEMLDVFEGPSRCNISVDGFKKTRREFYSAVRFANSFISSVVFNCEQFDWNRSEIERYSGNPWLQLYAADILLKDKGAFIIADLMLKKRSPEVRSTRVRARAQGLNHFYMTAHLQFLEFASILKRDGIDVIDENELGAGNFYQILIEKTTSDKYDFLYWIDVLRRMLGTTVLNKGFSFWFRDVPAILLPNFFCRAIDGWWSLKSRFVTVVSGFSESSNPFKKTVYQCLCIYRRIKHENTTSRRSA